MTKSFSETSPIDQQLPHVDDVAESMAQALFANAKDYLDGERPQFTALFVTTHEIHSRAATRFAALMSEAGLVELDQSDKTSKPETWHNTGNNKEYHVVCVHETVARRGGRLIVADSILDATNNQEPIMAQVQYKSTSISSADQA